MDLLSSSLDKYDYMMAAALLLGLAAVMAVILFLMGLPGRIAIKRGHPHAEAVRLMGWMGFLAVVPWVHAFMWAFHDSATVELMRQIIRRTDGSSSTTTTAWPSPSATVGSGDGGSDVSARSLAGR